jgi:hypothetical protein
MRFLPWPVRSVGRPPVAVALALVLAASAGSGAEAPGAKPKKAPTDPARHDPVDIPFRAAPMATATRSVIVSLGTNHHLAFDTELLNTHTAWQGGLLNLWGAVYHGGKDRFYCDYPGRTLWQQPGVFPWLVQEPDDNQRFTNSAPAGRYLGLDTRGPQTAFLYELTPQETHRPVLVRETPRRRPGLPEGVLERRYEIGPCERSLSLIAHAGPGTFITNRNNLSVLLVDRGSNVLLVAARADCRLRLVGIPEQVDYPTLLWSENKNDTVLATNRVRGTEARCYVRIPVHTNTVTVEVLSLVARDGPAALAALTALPKAPLQPAGRDADGFQPPKPAVFAGDKAFQLPAGDDAYRIERFPLPKEIELLVTGMDFLPNGDLAVCTWLGDVYIVEKPQGNPAAATYRRFARGLCEPGGLKVIDGRICLVQKQELTRLTDTDGNGEADRFECLSQGWGFTGNYHDFSFGPALDRQGNFVVLRNGNRGLYDVPFMGWGLRISRDGRTVDTISNGFRSPDGFGTWGPDGDIFMTDNQGNWVGACKLNHVRAGQFFGFPSTRPAARADFSGKPDRGFTPPAVWFPYKLAKSASGLVEMADARFGPFAGQMLVGDFQNALVMRVDLERVNGEWQGAVWPFAKGFNSGVHRLAFGPDGKLYVGGLKNKAWAAVAPKETSLDRVSFTGKVPFEVKTVRARPDGFELVFTEPVDAAAAGNPESFDVLQYNYHYHEKYGSPEYDHDGNENSATSIKVVKAEVSTDRLTVRLTVIGWKAGYVTMVRGLDVVSASGRKLRNDTFWYTLNQIPAR